MPPVGRKSPVADVGDMPVRRRLDVEDEIYAAVLCAVDFTAAEDHLTSPTTGTDLTGSEAETHQDRIQDSGDQVESPIARLSPSIRSPGHGVHLRVSMSPSERLTRPETPW